MHPSPTPTPVPSPRPPREDFAAVLARLDPPLGALSASERNSLLVAHCFVSTALSTWLGPRGDVPVSEADLRGTFDEALRLYNAHVARSS